MREQVADEMHTLMRHRTAERRGWATLFELVQIVTDFVLYCVFEAGSQVGGGGGKG